jgi:hypothetical protein
MNDLKSKPTTVYFISVLDDVQLLDMNLEDQRTIFEGRVGSGNRVDSLWIPPKCGRFKKARSGKPEDLCDITFVLAHADVPLFSRKAKEVFEPLLGEQAQWLALDFEDCEYWMLNLLRLVEIDEDKSEIRRFPSGKTSLITRYEFNKKDVANEWLFKTKIHTFRVHCTDRVRELVEKEGLTGFWFRPLWDSKVGSLTPPGKVA